MGLQQQEGWKSDWGKIRAGPFLQLPFSEGAGPAAKKGAMCLECGSSSKFGSWALDEEECGGQLARQWESSSAGRNGTLVSTVAGCPVAPERTVCSEQETRGLLVVVSDSLTDPDWAALGSNLLPWPH